MSTDTQQLINYQKNRDLILNKAKEYYQKKTKKKETNTEKIDITT